MKGPGRYYRKGMSLIEVLDMFPNDEAAEEWFLQVRWPDGVSCPHCHSENVQEGARHPTMNFRCRKCRKFFSVRVESPMQDSKLGYRIWALGFYLMANGTRGGSSMKLHRDLGIGEKAAWHMAHRIRECWDIEGVLPAGEAGKIAVPVEAEEAYFGGLEKEKPKAKKVDAGRSTVDKREVIDIKEHKSESVKGQAHTSGKESFRAVLKRGFHRMSSKLLGRDVRESAQRHKKGPKDTTDQQSALARSMRSKRKLTWFDS